MSHRELTIEASGLTLQIGRQVVFENMHLGVSSGEIVALVGPNGCGKTSLLNVFSGLLRASAGSVTLYGSPTNRAGPARIATLARGVARSFQVPFLQDEFSVWKNFLIGARIALAGGLEGTAFLDGVRRVSRALDLDGLHGAVTGALSLGQRRRVELVRTFSTCAGILLLDEPFANLDAAGTAAVGSLLRLAADNGAAVLIIEHQTDAIAKYSDRTVSMAAPK